MSKSKTIAPSLVRAYRQAQYFVHYGQEVLFLRAGFINHALGNLLRAKGKATAAFLTAYNPHSQVQDEQVNAQAHERLLSHLSAGEVEVIEGLGTDPQEEWDAEPSVLALGLTLSQAEQLADEFGQNAFLWIPNSQGFVNLKLRYPVGDPSVTEFEQWIAHLPENLRANAKALACEERNWLMTATDAEQQHWLSPDSWDWNTPWPNTRPDGCPISIGTEMDRMFKLVSNGMEKFHP